MLQLPSSEELNAALLGRTLTAIVFFLDQTFEELEYDVTTTVAEAAESIAAIIKLQNHSTFTLYESRRVRSLRQLPVLLAISRLHLSNARQDASVCWQVPALTATLTAGGGARKVQHFQALIDTGDAPLTPFSPLQHPRTSDGTGALSAAAPAKIYLLLAWSRLGSMRPKSPLTFGLTYTHVCSNRGRQMAQAQWEQQRQRRASCWTTTATWQTCCTTSSAPLCSACNKTLACTSLSWMSLPAC